jgi:hypothetical protein
VGRTRLSSSATRASNKVSGVRSSSGGGTRASPQAPGFRFEHNGQRPSSWTKESLADPEQIASGHEVPVFVEHVPAEHSLGMRQCRVANAKLEDDRVPALVDASPNVRSDSLCRCNALSERNLEECTDESRVLVGRYVGHVRHKSGRLSDECRHVQVGYHIAEVGEGDLPHENEGLPHGPHPAVAPPGPDGC